MGAARPHNPAARGELLGATAPWRNRSQTKNNKPALNTKLRILPSLFIKLSPPRFKGGLALLMFDAFEFPGDVSMQALVATVVLRTPRATAFQINAHGQPPHAELREPEQTIGTGKGNPIVAADGLRAIRSSPKRRSKHARTVAVRALGSARSSST